MLFKFLTDEQRNTPEAQAIIEDEELSRAMKRYKLKLLFDQENFREHLCIIQRKTRAKAKEVKAVE